MREPAFGQAVWYYVSGMEAPEKYIFECVHKVNYYKVVKGPERTVSILHSIGFYDSLEAATKEQVDYDYERLQEIEKSLDHLEAEKTRILRRQE